MSLSPHLRCICSGLFTRLMRITIPQSLARRAPSRPAKDRPPRSRTKNTTQLQSASSGGARPVDQVRLWLVSAHAVPRLGFALQCQGSLQNKLCAGTTPERCDRIPYSPRSLRPFDPKIAGRAGSTCRGSACGLASMLPLILACPGHSREECAMCCHLVCRFNRMALLRGQSTMIPCIEGIACGSRVSVFRHPGRGKRRALSVAFGDKLVFNRIYHRPSVWRLTSHVSRVIGELIGPSMFPCRRSVIGAAIAGQCSICTPQARGHP